MSVSSWLSIMELYPHRVWKSKTFLLQKECSCLPQVTVTGPPQPFPSFRAKYPGSWQALRFRIAIKQNRVCFRSQIRRRNGKSCLITYSFIKSITLGFFRLIIDIWDLSKRGGIPAVEWNLLENETTPRETPGEEIANRLRTSAV